MSVFLVLFLDWICYLDVYIEQTTLLNKVKHSNKPRGHIFYLWYELFCDRILHDSLQ